MGIYLPPHAIHTKLEIYAFYRSREIVLTIKVTQPPTKTA